MLFTQFEFLFLFLPLTFAGYFLIAYLVDAPAARLSWLAAASLVFYSYWDVRFVPIILVSIVFNYVMGLLIARQSNQTARGWVLAAAVTVNLAAIGFFKYTNFAIHIFDAITRAKYPSLAIVLPLGISFFTFTQIAYLADVYGGYPNEKSFTKYALFVTYFPHLIAGPILHHREMMPQFGSKAGRTLSAENVAIGLTILVIGLFKKSFIADGFALIANPVFQAAAQQHYLHILDAWAGAFAYSLQIYFDFSGYSDMAIGLSLLFGIRLPFNFDAPYKSQSIVEFWRRWHISLSRFLRDYLYIPLGGNRYGERRRSFNLAATMVLGGLWHGAGWTFVIWGALHGLFLTINHRWTEFAQKRPALARVTKSWWYPIAALVLTQVAIVFAWVFFRADNFHEAVRVIQAMAGRADQSRVAPRLVDVYGGASIALGYFACLILPNVNAMFAHWSVGLETYKNERPWSILNLTWRPSVAWALTTSLVLFVAVMINLVAGDSSQFLYFQF
ncbi:MAG TPA: MBOAT family protein [Bradyrhizobium sp.]|uniref:MBOAT family O-acyltransferase n=1 Tax=Bradyrhizobium sp. TaxID=376 RepID=UPI002BF10AAC|nr:MBOAT family protein [Bradyrhizobium sp.]HLZ03220.1 MBOAT family protein [Bradyrhizobium sp.]